MMAFKPHGYQTEAIKFLLENSNAGLFFDPGLGKTSCVLAQLLILKSRGMFKRALVVAPRRVCHEVWPHERAKWADFMPLSVSVLHGARKERELRTPGDICCVTPEGLQWLVDPKHNRLAALDPDVLVVDESSFFRHPNSLRFKTLREILGRFKRRIILTGTPNPRSYEDLWPQAYILDKGAALGRYISHYRTMYFQDVGYGYPDWKLRPGQDMVINDKMRPLVLRGDQVDHLEMPKLIHNTIAVALPAPAMAAYAELEKEFYIQLGGADVLAPNCAVLASKLRQVANGFVYTVDRQSKQIHDEKLVAVSNLISELQGSPALLLYEFNDDLSRLRAVLGAPPNIGAGVSDAQVAEYIRDFNAGKIPLLLAHPASAGHGLNMQGAAQHVIWYGPTWNLEHFEQATRRVWRQGNTHDRVFVHTIVAKDTIEERVAAVLASKDRTQRAFLAAMKREPVPA